MPIRESALESMLVRKVKEHGGFALKWVSPGNAGVPDRIVILPNGQTVYVEMKAPGKPLQPLQERWGRMLTTRNHRWYVLDSKEGIMDFIAKEFPE